MSKYNPEYHRLYRERNRVKIAISKKACYEAKREYYITKSKDYTLTHKDAQGKSKRKHFNTRYSQDITFRVSKCISNQIWKAIKTKKNNATWENIVGYSLQALRDHITSLFEEGMSWDNYGEWHIDHRAPICSFNFTDLQQVSNCWKLTNLRPLWKHQNLKKASSDKLLKNSSRQ